MVKSETQWKQDLGPGRYQILRERKTEAPNSHAYASFNPEKGHFRCAGCGHPLYSAASKFMSLCGWPCFDRVIYSKEGGCHVGAHFGGDDGGIGVICKNCGGHLGHVFYGEGCTPRNERH